MTSIVCPLTRHPPETLDRYAATVVQARILVTAGTWPTCTQINWQIYSKPSVWTLCQPTNQPTNHTYHTSIHVPNHSTSTASSSNVLPRPDHVLCPWHTDIKKKTSLPIYTSLVSSRVRLFPTAAGRAYNKRVAGRASCRGISSMRSPRYDWFLVDQ